ncbi:MAG: hypothetical protein K2H23_08325 [Oscillospiraceae bacterium]|nr:hypothetical protein [Oscillospiraceae bacterium]
MKKYKTAFFALCTVLAMSACDNSSEVGGTDLLTVTESVSAEVEFVGESVFTTTGSTKAVPADKVTLGSSGGTAPTFETVLIDTGTKKNYTEKSPQAAEVTTLYIPDDDDYGDDENYPKLTPIPQDTAVKLCDDFSVYASKIYNTAFTMDDVSILKYYGTYNSGEVVVMYPKGYDMTDDENEFTVKYWEYCLSSGSLKIFLHRDGTFTEIGEAYENGWLTNKDMKTIEYYNHNEDKTPERISWVYGPLGSIQASRERKIRGDYAKQQSEKLGWDMDYTDVSVIEYYGTCKNGELVVMNVNEMEHTSDMKYLNVAGYEFALSSGQFDIHLYKDGEFVELSEAYKKGYLNDEDIDMAAYYNRYSGIYTSFAGNYPELGRLSAEKERQIKADYIKFNEHAIDEWVSIEHYYGTYNGCEAVVMYSGVATADENWFSVAGYEMYLSSGSYVIHLHKDGTFYELSEAYEKGFLSEEDVADIAHYNREGSYYAFAE